MSSKKKHKGFRVKKEHIRMIEEMNVAMNVVETFKSDSEVITKMREMNKSKNLMGSEENPRKIEEINALEKLKAKPLKDFLAKKMRLQKQEFKDW